jgi:hypothetical protein
MNKMEVIVVQNCFVLYGNYYSILFYSILFLVLGKRGMIFLVSGKSGMIIPRNQNIIYANGILNDL